MNQIQTVKDELAWWHEACSCLHPDSKVTPESLLAEYKMTSKRELRELRAWLASIVAEALRPPPDDESSASDAPGSSS